MLTKAALLSMGRGCLFIRYCKYFNFCCKAYYLNMGLYADWLHFKASLKWPLEELQFLGLACGIYFCQLNHSFGMRMKYFTFQVFLSLLAIKWKMILFCHTVITSDLFSCSLKRQLKPALCTIFFVKATTFPDLISGWKKCLCYILMK